MSLYSVVVPVYNSEHTLEDLYTRLKRVFEETLHEEFELILVDDSSRDSSFQVMQKLRRLDRRVRIIQMARNFGQHPALLCGFHYVKGDFVITMDDDLQHPPEELPKMITVMNERPDVDVILARYEGRKHNIIRRAGTRLSVWATSKMLGKDPDLEITSFRLMPAFYCGRHRADQHPSAPDRQPAGDDLQPHHQCHRASRRPRLRKKRVFLRPSGKGSHLRYHFPLGLSAAGGAQHRTFGICGHTVFWPFTT